MNQPVITRHRFDIHRRELTVIEKSHVTPKMIRLVLQGPHLQEFHSLSPDDHIKLVFDQDGAEPMMREYTPRAFDLDAATITLDFAVHQAGPATQWAIDAQVGDSLKIAGPRGSAVIAQDFDWYLLIGDETALPAMGRWVEEMRPGTKVTTLGLVQDQAEEQDFTTAAELQAHWLHRADPTDPAVAVDAVADLPCPEGRGFVWIAAEAAVAKALREHFLTRWNHPRDCMKAAGYWVNGQADSSIKSID